MWRAYNVDSVKCFRRTKISKLKVTVRTAVGDFELEADQCRIDQSGVLAVGNDDKTELYAGGFWYHTTVEKTNETDTLVEETA